MFFSFFLDKSSTSAALARQYGAVCLSVDAVAADVLLNGTSPASLTARQLFDSAAVEYAQKNPGKLEVREVGCDGQINKNVFNWFNWFRKRL